MRWCGWTGFERWPPTASFSQYVCSVAGNGERHMRLLFEMSGISGEREAALDTEIDVDELPDLERRAVEETVQAVRSGDDAGLETSAASEGTTYRLLIRPSRNTTSRSDDAEEIEMIFDERTLPVDLLPLIEVLRDRAIEERIAKNRQQQERPGDLS